MNKQIKKRQYSSTLSPSKWSENFLSKGKIKSMSLECTKSIQHFSSLFNKISYIPILIEFNPFPFERLIACRFKYLKSCYIVITSFLHPHFQPLFSRLTDLLAPLLRRVANRIVARPLKRNEARQLKEVPRSQNSTLFFFFFFCRWRESMKFERGLPPRGTWVFRTRWNKSLGDKPRESHPHLLERFYFLRGNRLFERA